MQDYPFFSTDQRVAEKDSGLPYTRPLPSHWTLLINLREYAMQYTVSSKIIGTNVFAIAEGLRSASKDENFIFVS